MSEFKLPPPRRLLRCDVPRRHDDALVEPDMPIFAEVAAIEPTLGERDDISVLVAELVDELSISLTLIDDVNEGYHEAGPHEAVAEVA